MTMTRSKSDVALSAIRQRSSQILLTMALLYVSIVFVFELPSVFRRLSGADNDLRRPLDSNEETLQNFAPVRPYRHLVHASSSSYPFVSGLVLHPFNTTDLGVISELHQSADHAWDLGRKVLDDLRSASPPSTEDRIRTEESCPHSLSLTGDEVRDRGQVMVLPCGLSLGSHVTVIGRPRRAHEERDPKISRPKGGDEGVMVSQFMMELQGIKAVDGEAPPKILHFNPRLKGDWSGRPVIEQNTCYRMQWSTPLRCDGRKSKKFEETVDGLVKCEEWSHEDDQPDNSNTTWWLNRHAKKHLHDWMYPFVEDELFVLTLSAGMEGYHVTVNGRHLTSFPYRPGFVLEDATGLALNGDIDIQSIFVASLPTSHPSIFPQETLEFLPEWKASLLPNGSVDLFIGIISAGNHFAERMAVRKSWMSSVRKSSNIVARFFVALHGRKEVNVELKKEAEFFGDIIIVPFMDSYDLVVLKTIAICEYGVRTISAKYIMKCDDDTFVRINIVIDEVNKIPSDGSLYAGNMNYHHKPLRSGKWAVTYEEWSEEDYPPYANGPGYIISSDIARFVISEFENDTLKLFKMEDVSMGMWVEQFNISRPVEYIHSLRFCQFGCIEGYVTAHYQSPRQMMCLWDKLQAGRPHCCNMR